MTPRRRFWPLAWLLLLSASCDNSQASEAWIEKAQKMTGSLWESYGERLSSRVRPVSDGFLASHRKFKANQVESPFPSLGANAVRHQ